MKARKTNKTRQPEAGVALLISIFVLLLISVVAIALIVSSGTESALAGNYRSSTGVYYAAVSGLEEARGRLLTKNPSSFKTTDPGLLPAPGATLPIGTVAYVLNPGPTEAMGNILTTYPDTEYDQEFGPGALAAATVKPPAKSVWNRSPLNSLNVPGPLYKWVRINAVSEKSLNLDVDADSLADSTTPLYYDSSLSRFSNSSSAGPQVLEITSLAALPNGSQKISQKIVQYLVTSVPITLPPFLAALTISGSNGGGNPVFQAPANNNVYAVKGDGDQDCSGNPLPSKVAIGIFGDYSGGSYNTAVSNAISGIPSFPPSSLAQSSYTGQSPAPDVQYLSAYPTNMQTPSQLDAIMQTIAQNADVTIPSGPITYPLPTVTESALTPLGMSSSNLQTVVVNGNLDVTGWSGTGYGLLLVMGTFTYDPNATWNGIVLVVGQGIVNNIDHGQYKQMNGAVFVAKTRDPSGNLLPDPRVGGASVAFDAPMEGNGIRYSSCWIQKARPSSSYKILSFHEISQ